MGLFTVLSGATVMVALLSFIDGMISLDSFPFPIIVPFLLSFLGFMMISVVDPFMLSSTSDGLGFSSSSSFHHQSIFTSSSNGDGSGGDPYIQIRQRASFVLGVMLLLISTCISLTVNGFENESTGCAKDGVASYWPGFSLVFQGWCWLVAATLLYVDKCIVIRGSSVGSILSQQDE